MTNPLFDLPLSTGRFVGRDRDVAELRSLLHESRVITLTGTGGIGKTRLAVRVAEQAAPRFPDGVRFVDLSTAFSAEQAIDAIARVLRVAEEQEGDRRGAVITALRGQRLLLLLDTCEHVITPIAELCRLLLRCCPNLSVLATSREPLRIPGETVWRVPPLSLPARPIGQPGALSPSPGPTVEEAMGYESVQLFERRARAARPSFAVTPDNVAQIIEICHVLDGLPLAIELAAARTRILSVEQILRRLDNRFRLLVTSERDLPPRQRTMRAAVEWSHDALTVPEQVLLRRLSVFSTWHAEMAEEICGFAGLAAEDILDLQGALLDKSLIVLDTEAEGIARYRLLETVAAYAAEQLAATGDEGDTLRRRFLTYMADRAGTATAVEAKDWNERLRTLRNTDHDLGNIRSLIAWALRSGHLRDGLRICVALRDYWIIRGLFAEGSSHLRDLLAAIDASPGEVAEQELNRARVVYGELCLDVDGPDTARPPVQAALAASRGAGDSHAEGWALLALSMIDMRRGDTASGRRRAERAIELGRTRGDRPMEMTALGSMGLLANQERDDERSDRLLCAALRIAEEIGDAWHGARCHNVLGMVATRRGEPEAARAHLDTALGVFVSTGSTLDIARCAAAAGRLAMATSDVAAARRHLSECLRLSLASGRPLATVRALANLSRLAVAEGQPARAALIDGAVAALRSQSGGALAGEQPTVSAPVGLDAETHRAWVRGARLPLERVVQEVLSFPESAPAHPPLTPRENEIATLVGSGLSNREIAARLTITRPTAARHIANIFGKLGFSSRAQLAEWVSREGKANH
ncbi:ATP-binding protein [Salinactinospora qingdaonensis]|uniref:HTH luxR-type domain-containing protein n=1 Tax=Salinactinospora qingdaonensis TaxID=702744 RepID=A0ABP7GA38_9ACTN